MPVHIDDLDRRILSAIQKDARLSSEELALRVHSSAATCLRRLRRLRDSGVIAGEVTLLDPQKVCRSLTVFVHVLLERQSQSHQESFERQVGKLSEVRQCYMTSGDADFVLLVNVQDMHAYMEFVQKNLTEHENVRNFRSFFAMRRSKFETELIVY